MTKSLNFDLEDFYHIQNNHLKYLKIHRIHLNLIIDASIPSIDVPLINPIAI